MKWCDCSHCIRRRVWTGWSMLLWVGFAVIGIVHLLNGKWLWGGAVFASNAGLLFVLLNYPNRLSENQICKVELAAAMLKGEEDDLLSDWGGLMTGRPVQPPPGKVLKCGTVMK